jgi:predicted 3-demethylubiquinone-9 3-methyltransferase (glyoxalase superfamily)
VSWQIVPTAMIQMLKAGDPDKANRVMQAELQMKKRDIQTLQKAFER